MRPYYVWKDWRFYLLQLFLQRQYTSFTAALLLELKLCELGNDSTLNYAPTSFDRFIQFTRVCWDEVNFAKLVHQLKLFCSFVHAVVVKAHDETSVPILRLYVALYVRHELKEARAFRRFMDFEVSVVFQAVGHRSIQCETFTSGLRCRHFKTIAFLPPGFLLDQPSIPCVSSERDLTNENYSRQNI